MVKFLVDSTFGVTREYAQNNDISVVSLTVLLGSHEYDEGYPDEWETFYNELARTKNGGKTSQPSPDKFIKAISEIYEKDENSEIILLTIADRLSGTIGSANIAVAQFPERKIAAVNSFEAGPSAFLMLDELVKARNEGATFEQLLELTEDLKKRIAMQFIPASLTELARGGRVNKLLSYVGNILQLKPVFEFAENKLQIYAKALGFNRAVDAAIAHLPKKFDRLFVYYIGDDKNIEPLKNRLYRKLGMAEIQVVPMCPVGGIHIGIGTVGIVTLASK